MSAGRRARTIAKTFGRAAAWAPVTLLFGGSLAIAAMSSLRPLETGRLAVVFPPWWSAERSLATASQFAAATGVGGFSFIVGVAEGRPGLASELGDAGALFVLDGSRFSACFSRRQTSEPK